MAARTGMSNVILALRAATKAGLADTTVGGVTFWSDDQLQDRLDRKRETLTHIYLDPEPVYDAGTWKYYDYCIPGEPGSYFEESGTNSGWAVRDTNGGTVSGYTVNYSARRITFAADQRGSAHFLDARTYDFNRTAAQVWREKAGLIADAVDWSSDNHRFNDSQEYDHCIKQAEKFENQSGISSSSFFRTDEVWGW